MSFQAYLDTIKAKTGKTPEDFKVLAEKKGLLKPGVKAKQIIDWLKADFDLGYGHAMAIYGTLTAPTVSLSIEEKVAKHFSGKKDVWRQPYDELLARLKTFGKDVQVGTTDTYISLLRGEKKFGIVQIKTERMEVGIKLKGKPYTERFTDAAKWNAMVTHRVEIEDPAELNAELLSWLREAYEKAGA